MSEYENEHSDAFCEEADGCPTEGAVLKRAWREHRAEIERLTKELNEFRSLYAYGSVSNTSLTKEVARLKEDARRGKPELSRLDAADAALQRISALLGGPDEWTDQAAMIHDVLALVEERLLSRTEAEA